MLSLEQKKAIFSLFELEEKEMSNGRIDYDYPASKQRGKKLATQLYKSGNGYVIGKYMTEEAIKSNQYEVDPRGWINIMHFSSQELKQVIIEAMISMSTAEDIHMVDESDDSDEMELICEEPNYFDNQYDEQETTEPSDLPPVVENYFRIIHGQLKLLEDAQDISINLRTNFIDGILSVWESFLPRK